MRILLLMSFMILCVSAAHGQGTIRGKITDQNGEPLIGATVVLQSDRSKGTSADLDGNYSLKLPDSSSQKLIISYISFRSVEEAVQLRKGEITVRNFILKPATQEITAVEISAKQVRAKEQYIEQIKKNSSVTLDYVSAEVIKRTGDASVATAVARVPGISTSNGIITVRGISDRYVKSSINGFKIPTLDPFTNNFKLDLLPAALVDNVLVTKTASPDLPGDWAGAYLSVETKDYPEYLSLNIESSVTYNAQTTFKDALTSQGSSTDWLGYDNGYRDFNHADYAAFRISPGIYWQYVALGLGDYFSSMGISSTTEWKESYTKLGLVQLGLLAKADFDNEQAIAAAKEKYDTGPYKSQAFQIVNADAVQAAQKFPSNWNTYSVKAPLGFSQSITAGNQVTLLKKPVGFILGYRYGSSFQSDPESTFNRHTIEDGKKINSSINSEQNVSKESNGWSALANVSCKLNPNNSIGLLFMPNFTGVNDVRNTREIYSDGSLNWLHANCVPAQIGTLFSCSESKN